MSSSFVPDREAVTSPTQSFGTQPSLKYLSQSPSSSGQASKASLSSSSYQQDSKNLFPPQALKSFGTSPATLSDGPENLVSSWGHSSPPSYLSHHQSYSPPLPTPSNLGPGSTISRSNQFTPTTLPPVQPSYHEFSSSINYRSHQATHYNNMSAETVEAFYRKADNGAYRHGPKSDGNRHRSFRQQPTGSVILPTIAMDAPDGSFRRQIPQNARLFDHRDTSHVRFGDQQGSLEGKAAVQSEFLEAIALRELQKQVSPKEMVTKENFRKKLERIVHLTLTDYAKDHVIPFTPNEVRLKTYGSLANGFAVAGSDMDLLLMFPKDKGPLGSIEMESRRMLEKAFLNEGYGARLLTQTRVPIMRVCEHPNAELLTALKQKREEWEREETESKGKNASIKKLGEADDMKLPSDPSETSFSAAESFFAELDIDPASIELPPSPIQGHAHLEFKGDVGVQCDINFSNYVAIYNTALLRCYCKCDPRVREMVLAVKAWAKARKVNNPYHGTLSSYGYVIMVLHYLMNIAQPPVIPNLQQVAQKNRAKKRPPPPPKMCEGMDVTFFDDEREISRMAKAGQATINREMLGSLLRGFFRYYADHRGFHWTKNVISIRTAGGLMTKEMKSWTGARWDGSEKTVRQRYLLAIEDPFEIHHNIARTVGHSGIVAIRDEFRRALDILNNVQSIPGAGWQWRNPDGTVGEDFYQPAEDRGDLHRKDQNKYAERMRAARASAKVASVESGKAQKSPGWESTAAQGQGVGPVEADGKKTEPKERVELTEQRKEKVKGQEWKAKRGRKKHVVNGDVSRSDDKPSPQGDDKKEKQPEANGFLTYSHMSDRERSSDMPLHWPHSGFDPSRYGRPAPTQTPPQTPTCAKPTTPIPNAPPREVQPTPPPSPGLPMPKDVNTKDKDAWMFISAPTLLDPRQLCDIQTIQHGGNGCVRLAEDFESSWGGGGRMGTNRDAQYSTSSRRRGKVLAEEGRSDDVGSQWSEVVDGMVRSRGMDWRGGRRMEQDAKVRTEETDSGELVGELPFCGKNED